MSDGYCEVDFGDAMDDCEPISEHRMNVVTARREHQCMECREPIRVGDTYRRDSYRFEGQLQVDRTCEPCREVRGEFDFQIFGGCLWEYFGEEWSNGANVQGCMNRLVTARAKEHMRRRWLKWKGVS